MKITAAATWGLVLGTHLAAAPPVWRVVKDSAGAANLLRNPSFEIQRGNVWDRVVLALDFFDASINRIGAYVTGTRAARKGILYALLDPTAQLQAYEAEGKNAQRLALMEEFKSMPFAAVWDKLCEQGNVPVGADWIELDIFRTKDGKLVVIHDRTTTGQPLKWLAITDEYTRECLALEVARSITADHVVDILTSLFLSRGVPTHIRSDNGPEFIAHKLIDWAKEEADRRHCSMAQVIRTAMVENPIDIEEVPEIMKVGWCGKEECGLKIEEKTDTSALGTAENEEKADGRCPVCGDPAKTYLYFAKTY